MPHHDGERRRTRDGRSVKRYVFDVTLRFQGGAVTAAVPVPDVEMRLADFLPLLHGLQDAVTVGVAKDVQRRGQAISCRAGCGACCRQPVPIGESEAVRLAELVASMPEERQARIRQRFAASLCTLEEHGLLEGVRAYSTSDRDERMRLGMKYFRLGVACPFLEDESCGIYEHRPLRCREFLVTSPPEHCAKDSPGNIVRTPSPPGPWSVIYRFEDGMGQTEPSWVALILALEFAAERAQMPLPTFSAPEMFKNLLAQLSADTEAPD